MNIPGKAFIFNNREAKACLLLAAKRKAVGMMAAMLKAVSWVMAVSVPILLFWSGTATPNRSYAITVAAITGGFLFGVGAAVNAASHRKSPKSRLHQ